MSYASFFEKESIVKLGATDYTEKGTVFRQIL